MTKPRTWTVTKVDPVSKTITLERTRRIHISRRRRAVLQRYPEFIAALRPTNLRDFPVSTRVNLMDAVRRAYPPACLSYVWRGLATFDQVVDGARERIKLAQPLMEWRA